jgi:ATP-dependent helicase/nuclease subunit A
MTEDPKLWRDLQERLAWQYAFSGATRHPAKTSVSALRRRTVAAQPEEVRSLFGTETSTSRAQSSKPQVRGSVFRSAGRAAAPPSQASAADIGNAHHAFLQLIRLPAISSLAGLKAEAARLEREGSLSAEEIALLDFKALAALGNSDLGRKICAQASSAQRELAFTARFAASELARLTGMPTEPGLADDFVVVQGVADLVLLLPQELWLVDFKTDATTPEELPAKTKFYEPQLQIYALALSRIYRRPVTECWLYFLTAQKAVPLKSASIPV